MSAHLPASHLFRWTERDLGRWTLRPGGGSAAHLCERDGGAPFLDPERRFLCTMSYEGDDPFGALDPESARWSLTIQGRHPGGRRTSGPYLTFAEAQAQAARWLDRRFVTVYEPTDGSGDDRCPSARSARDLYRQPA